MSAPCERAEVVVIGAGPAGLGVAAELRRVGIEATVLERSQQVGASWRGRYPSLRLNNDRWSARLPRSWMRGADRWPRRDQFVSYLERYAESRELEIRFGVAVREVQRAAGGWRLVSAEGALFAHFVVVCTGHDREPTLPEWPDAEGFRGRLLHAAEFGGAREFRGQDVLVVGCGTSATEIATRLAAEGAKRVRVAVRTPPNLMPEHFLGVPITFFARALENAQRWLVDLLSSLPRRVAIGGLSEYGIDRAPFGVGTELRLKGMGPVIDRGFVEAVKAGRLEVVSALEGFDQDAVLLSDGSRIRPQVVIAATGYRPGLEGLVGALGVLGKPSVLGAETHPHAPGLYFCGYRLPLSGELSGMRRDSRQIARAIAGRRRRSRRTGAS